MTPPRLSAATDAWISRAPTTSSAAAGGRAAAEGTVPRRTLMLAFTATGAPKPKGSLKHVGHGRLVDQVKGTGAWGDAVEDAAKAAMVSKHYRTYGGFPAGGLALGFPLFGPLIVELVVTVPALKKPRRWPDTRSSADLDKHQRNVGDALTKAGVMKDDAQIVRWEAEKTYPGRHPDALDSPGAVIRIWAIGGAS